MRVGTGGLGIAVSGTSVGGIGSGSGGGGFGRHGIGGHGSGLGYPRFVAHAGMVRASPLPAALAGALGIDLEGCFALAGTPSVVSPFPGAHFD